MPTRAEQESRVLTEIPERGVPMIPGGGEAGYTGGSGQG